MPERRVPPDPPAGRTFTEEGRFGVCAASVVVLLLLLLFFFFFLYGCLLPPLHLLHCPHLAFEAKQTLPQTHCHVVALVSAAAATAAVVAAALGLYGGS